MKIQQIVPGVGFVILTVKAWILFEHCLKISDYTMDVKGEFSRNFLSGDGLRWLSRVCCLLCVGR